MYYPIKIAEIDLSFFTGNPTQLVLTAEDAEHGYNYALTYYHSDDSQPLGCSERWAFYDEPNADVPAYFMADKIKEILG